MSLLSRITGAVSSATRTVAAPAIRRLTAFEAGKYGRRLRAVPTTQEAVNRLIRTYGRTVVARSRYLCANNPYASAAKEAYVNALVGSGIKPSSLVESSETRKNLQLLWKDWTDQSDADGITDFYGQQYMIAGEMFEAGECFVRIRPRRPEDGLMLPFQLQILPSEMLDMAHNVQNAGEGSSRIECGIEFDAIGRRVAYHFFNRHPQNDSTASLVRRRVPADQILHLYKPMQAGQIRGVPHTISGIVRLAILDAYEDAELERKRTSALFAGFVTRPAQEDADHPLENVGEESAYIPGMASAVGLEPGAMVDLAPGEEVAFAEPTDVGTTYEPFMYRNLLGVAAGFGIPYMNMTGDLRQTSYGSQRGGDIAFRRRIEAAQNHVMIYQFCRPVWNRFLDEAVLAGVEGISRALYVSAPQQFRRVRWIVPKWEWIDPLKDRQAEKLAVDEGWKSRDDVIEAEGFDPEENDARIVASQERADELGIKIGTQPEPPVGFGEDEPEEPAAEPSREDERSSRKPRKETAR